MWPQEVTAFPKQFGKLDKAADKKGSEEVKLRSGGRCEVREVVTTGMSYGFFPCFRRAAHIHHMLDGIGVRGRGPSCLPEHKQAVCPVHHREIHGDVGGKKLQLVQSGPLPVYTDVYRRAA